MGAYLIVKHGNKRRTLALRGRTTIGRSSDCGVVIASQGTSRRHAVIHKHENEWYLEDTGSLNGTFVNGEWLDGPHRLRRGDRIVIGSAKLRLAVGADLPESLEPTPAGPDHPRHYIIGCPHCLARLSAVTGMANMVERCPSCRRRFVLTEPRPAPLDLNEAAAEMASPEPKTMAAIPRPEDRPPPAPRPVPPPPARRRHAPQARRPMPLPQPEAVEAGHDETGSLRATPWTAAARETPGAVAARPAPWAGAAWAAPTRGECHAAAAPRTPAAARAPAGAARTRAMPDAVAHRPAPWIDGNRDAPSAGEAHAAEPGRTPRSVERQEAGTAMARTMPDAAAQRAVIGQAPAMQGCNRLPPNDREFHDRQPPAAVTREARIAGDAPTRRDHRRPAAPPPAPRPEAGQAGARKRRWERWDRMIAAVPADRSGPGTASEDRPANHADDAAAPPIGDVPAAGQVESRPSPSGLFSLFERAPRPASARAKAPSAPPVTAPRAGTLRRRAKTILRRQGELAGLSDADFKAHLLPIRVAMQSGKEQEAQVDGAMAAAAEALRRDVGRGPSAEQVAAALGIESRCVVEPLAPLDAEAAAALAGALAGWRARGCHLVVADDDQALALARRWLGFHKQCGLRPAWIGRATKTAVRRRAYLASVTYVSLANLATDHLHDRAVALARPHAVALLQSRWASHRDTLGQQPIMRSSASAIVLDAATLAERAGERIEPVNPLPLPPDGPETAGTITTREVLAQYPRLGGASGRRPGAGRQIRKLYPMGCVWPGKADWRSLWGWVGK